MRICVAQQNLLVSDYANITLTHTHTNTQPTAAETLGWDANGCLSLIGRSVPHLNRLQLDVRSDQGLNAEGLALLPRGLQRLVLRGVVCLREEEVQVCVL